MKFGRLIVVVHVIFGIFLLMGNIYADDLAVKTKEQLIKNILLKPARLPRKTACELKRVKCIYNSVDSEDCDELYLECLSPQENWSPQETNPRQY